jgi:hypothetical protein
MSCTICNHPQRQKIDQALVAGTTTLAALSMEYGLSTSALHRHKAHLQAKISRAQDQLHNNLRQGCIFWLSQALEMISQTAQAAQAEDNFKVVLQAVRQGTRLINIILKQDLQLDDTIIYQILASPQWTTQASLLPHDPEIMSISRQALIGKLAAPCPETTTQPTSSESMSDLGGLDLDMLQALFPALAQPATAQPKTANRPLQPREKSGKLPGKNQHRNNNSEKNQEDILYEKITGMTSLPLLARTVPPEIQNSKLETLLQQCENTGKVPTNIPLSEYIYEQSLRDNQQKTL